MLKHGNSVFVYFCLLIFISDHVDHFVDGVMNPKQVSSRPEQCPVISEINTVQLLGKKFGDRTTANELVAILTSALSASSCKYRIGNRLY